MNAPRLYRTSLRLSIAVLALTVLAVVFLQYYYDVRSAFYPWKYDEAIETAIRFSEAPADSVAERIDVVYVFPFAKYDFHEYPLFRIMSRTPSGVIVTNQEITRLILALRSRHRGDYSLDRSGPSFHLLFVDSESKAVGYVICDYDYQNGPTMTVHSPVGSIIHSRQTLAYFLERGFIH